MSSQLHYHKCHDCLTAFSSTEAKIDECDCGGNVYYMGQVKGDKYEKLENRPPCDGRCTNAAGPVCNCKCGCVNHGTGRLVATVVAQGKVKVQGLTEQDIERAELYRKLRDYATMLFEKKWHDKSSLTYQQATAYSKDQQFIKKALKSKVYKKRNDMLIDFIVQNKRFKDGA